MFWQLVKPALTSVTQFENQYSFEHRHRKNARVLSHYLMSQTGQMLNDGIVCHWLKVNCESCPDCFIPCKTSTKFKKERKINLSGKLTASIGITGENPKTLPFIL